eukprot:g1731.t1
MVVERPAAPSTPSNSSKVTPHDDDVVDEEENRQTNTWGAFIDPRDEAAFLRLRLKQVGKQTGSNFVVTGVVFCILYGLGSESSAAELSYAWLFWSFRIGCAAIFVAAGFALRWQLPFVDVLWLRRFILPAYATTLAAMGYFFLLFQDGLEDKYLAGNIHWGAGAAGQAAGHENAAGTALLRFAVVRTHATSYKLAAEIGIVACLMCVHSCRGLLEGQRTAAIGALTVAFQLAVTALSRAQLLRQGHRVEMESYAPYLQQAGLCMFAVYLVISKELESMHRRRHLYADHQRRLALARAKAGAEASQRAHSRFVATFSHELRTPLTSIIGNLEMLCLGPGDASDVRARAVGASVGAAPTQPRPGDGKHAARAMSSARLLLSLVNSILDLSRLEAGALVLQRRQFSVHDMLRVVEDVVRTAAEAKDIAVTFRVDAAVPAVLCGDPTRFQQLILNITANACKFTPQRGNIAVDVTVARRSSDSGGGGGSGSGSGAVTLRIRIRDSGIGIPRSELEHIWRMFYTVEVEADSVHAHSAKPPGTHTRALDRSSGSGCGLAICKQLVELMGGGVAVASEVGRGSTFTITVMLELPQDGGQGVDGGVGVGGGQFMGQSPLRVAPHPAPAPMHAHAHAHAHALAPASAPAAAAQRVLLAEDNAFNAEVLAEMLSGSCQVTCTSDGAQAVAAFTAAAGSGQPFDLVLMDCNMPRKNGFAATREIRQWEREAGARRTPVVALTAHGEGDRHVREQCNAAGMDSFISKPVQRDELVKRVSHEIDTADAATAT